MRDQRALCAVVAGTLFALLCGCGSTTDPDDPLDPTEPDPTDPTDPAIPDEFEVRLVTTATGMQRINFAIPLPIGTQSTADLRVLGGSTELPSARRVLATYPDGSARSIHVQADVDVAATKALTIQLGTASPTLDFVPVPQTLAGTGNNVAPKVFVLLPTEILTASSIAGPVAPRAEMVGTPLDAWSQLCDYAKWDTNAFLVSSATSRDVWLFDRVTAMYRGYAITGDVVPLRSAYREAAIYQAGMTVSAAGVATNIAVPGAQTDLKYYYAQGMALHYLLTGDDRFREAAEAVSAKVVSMWDPDYNGTDEFWTERHAGFALLAHEWAAIVSDDKAATIAGRADAAVSAFLAAQMAPRFGQSDSEARCFAHTATAHGESWGGNGCSPWMSAILADALDAHARRVGGDRAVQVRAALARLGRAIVKEGRDSTGRPLYWMGVGTSADQVDEYDEHWGESAYIVALAWNATGRSEAALKTAADALVLGVRDRGEVGQVRSFNWQCRSSVMAPALLR